MIDEKCLFVENYTIPLDHLEFECSSHKKYPLSQRQVRSIPVVTPVRKSVKNILPGEFLKILSTSIIF